MTTKTLVTYIFDIQLIITMELKYDKWYFGKSAYRPRRLQQRQRARGML